MSLFVKKKSAHLVLGRTGKLVGYLNSLQNHSITPEHSFIAEKKHRKGKSFEFRLRTVVFQFLSAFKFSSLLVAKMRLWKKVESRFYGD